MIWSKTVHTCEYVHNSMETTNSQEISFEIFMGQT